MLKIATWDDYADILDMTMKFGLMMYRDHFEFEEHKLAEGIRGFLEADRSQKIIILATDNGKNIGMLAAVCSEAPFSTKKIAYEMIWWMEPDHRKSRTAIELVKAYEFWAEKVGADLLQMSSVDSDKSPSIDRFYKRRGYTPLERGYIKQNARD